MLPIISRKKGNLTKKFGELIKNIIYLIQYINEYNIYIYIYIYIYIIYLKKSLLK